MAVAALALSTAAAAPAAAGPNAIQLENAKPGTTAWELPGETPTSLATPSTAIEGYSSQVSVQPGDTLALHIDTTPAAPYRVEIYRLGWYGGAGGRWMACLPSCAGSELGIDQPVPSPDPTTGVLDAGWRVTDTVTIGANWTSGYYIAKLVLLGGPDQGQASLVPFIVRAAPGVHSAILVQASVNTWEAYNNWGGKSLYTYNTSPSPVAASHTNAAAIVSFNRPFAVPMDLFRWEYNRVRYLERNGFDVTYQSDVDTDLNPSSLLGHRLDIVSGHDEYWSSTMRNAYEAARAAGVNLAFLGGNIGYWQVRYANGDRSLVEYRSAAYDPDPVAAQKTVAFSAAPINRPECELLGVGYPGGLAQTSDPPRSYVATAAAASAPWFAGTGLTPGSTIYDSVGYEWDQVQSGCAVPSPTVLLHFPGLHGVKGSPNPADAVIYTAPSGARVFSDGTMQLAWALDDFGHAPHADGRVQRLFTNIFDALGGAPSQPASSAPRPFRLLAPRPAVAIWTPLPTLRWTASGDPGSGLAGYAVMVDGRQVAFTTHTSYRPAFPLSEGRHHWRVVAVDRAGNRAPTHARVFIVRSVRWRPLLHAHRLLVQVFCARACTVRAALRLTAGAGSLAVRAGRLAHAGVLDLSLALPVSATRELSSPTRLALTVLTRWTRTHRTVRSLLRW